MPEMPQWDPPDDIVKALAEGDGFWDDERWSPILVTLMSGIEYQGREIPVVWQIEFDPMSDAIKAANVQLEEAGIRPDGYNWGESIRRAILARNPELAERLHLTDCETGACVIWVESEGDCRDLLEATWRLVFAA